MRTRDTTKLEEPWCTLAGTLVEPWWNLGGTLAEPPCNLGGTFRRTFWQLKRNLPRRPETPRNLCNLGGTLAESWWNLQRNLLAAQDGSAPQNHRESESNSSPKPLLWLKTPKPLLLANDMRKGTSVFLTTDSIW